MTDIAVPPSRGAGSGRVLSERTVIGSLSVLTGLILWELVARANLISPFLVSSPSAIAEAFIDLTASGELQRQLLISGKEFAVGLILSIVIGLPVAVIAGWYTRAGWFLQPLVAALYAAPTIALFPLIIIFLGIGFWDKVLLVFISGFLQIFVATSAGIRATDRKWVRLARSFRASERKMFWSIILPNGLPYILLGLRLAVGRCVVNVVVAEMLASEGGLGYMIAYYGNTFQVSKVFVALAAVVVTGVILNQMLLVVEQRVGRWRPSTR
ncbi:NitT/TauT family transport system permease protein [Rhodoligotrophos appendicifer]|uniref:ABC transporter permease n=1 Tax=Rhodoligotrophos appendicifer TaxID=987056 RepID=UPI0011854EE7|nr:ABC transporter permease [Rhodoligotrophos appendicifer]